MGKKRKPKLASAKPKSKDLSPEERVLASLERNIKRLDRLKKERLALEVKGIVIRDPFRRGATFDAIKRVKQVQRLRTQLLATIKDVKSGMDPERAKVTSRVAGLALGFIKLEMDYSEMGGARVVKPVVLLRKGKVK